MGIEVIKRNLKGEHLYGWECGNLIFYGEMSNVWLGTVVVKIYSQKGRKNVYRKKQIILKNCLISYSDPYGKGSPLDKGVD